MHTKDQWQKLPSLKKGSVYSEGRWLRYLFMKPVLSHQSHRGHRVDDILSDGAGQHLQAEACGPFLGRRGGVQDAASGWREVEAEPGFSQDGQRA